MLDQQYHDNCCMEVSCLFLSLDPVLITRHTYSNPRLRNASCPDQQRRSGPVHLELQKARAQTADDDQRTGRQRLLLRFPFGADEHQQSQQNGRGKSAFVDRGKVLRPARRGWKLMGPDDRASPTSPTPRRKGSKNFRGSARSRSRGSEMRLINRSKEPRLLLPDLRFNHSSH